MSRLEGRRRWEDVGRCVGVRGGEDIVAVPSVERYRSVYGRVEGVNVGGGVRGDAVRICLRWVLLAGETCFP